MAEELKPCPFCGGNAELIDIGNECLYDKKYSVECKNCYCNTDWFKARKEAIGAWNRRANND